MQQSHERHTEAPSDHKTQDEYMQYYSGKSVSYGIGNLTFM